jgi:hypothetical protein
MSLVGPLDAECATPQVPGHISPWHVGPWQIHPSFQPVWKRVDRKAVRVGGKRKRHSVAARPSCECQRFLHLKGAIDRDSEEWNLRSY